MKASLNLDARTAPTSEAGMQLCKDDRQSLQPNENHLFDKGQLSYPGPQVRRHQDRKEAGAHLDQLCAPTPQICLLWGGL